LKNLDLNSLGYARENGKKGNINGIKSKSITNTEGGDEKAGS